MIKFILLFLFSFSAIASDFISARNDFLHRLDTAQVLMTKANILHNKTKGVVENTLTEFKLKEYGINPHHFVAATYSDKNNTYSIGLDFKGDNSSMCVLTINDVENYTRVTQSNISDTYCENLLGVVLYHHMKYSLKWEAAKAVLALFANLT